MGHIKDLVYQQKIETLDALPHHILDAAST
jgi:hypothetical protein